MVPNIEYSRINELAIESEYSFCGHNAQNLIRHQHHEVRDQYTFYACAINGGLFIDVRVPTTKYTARGLRGLQCSGNPRLELGHHISFLPTTQGSAQTLLYIKYGLSFKLGLLLGPVIVAYIM